MSQVDGAKLTGVPEDSISCPSPAPGMKAPHYGWGTFTLPRSSQPSLGSQPWQPQPPPLPPRSAGSADCSLRSAFPHGRQSTCFCLSFLLCVPVLLCGSLTLDLAFPAVQRLFPTPGPQQQKEARPLTGAAGRAPGIPVLQRPWAQQVQLFQTLQKPGLGDPADPASGGGHPAGARTAAPRSTGPVTLSCQRGLPSSPRRRQKVTQQALGSSGL